MRNLREQIIESYCGYSTIENFKDKKEYLAVKKEAKSQLLLSIAINAYRSGYITIEEPNDELYLNWNKTGVMRGKLHGITEEQFKEYMQLKVKEYIRLKEEKIMSELSKKP